MQNSSQAEELVHLYVDGAFDRRELMRRLRKIGGVAGAVSLLASMGVASADTAPCGCPDDVRVPPDAEDLDSQLVQYPGDASNIFGYVSRPRTGSSDPLPAILVIHENRGLTDYIKDVTRRTARAGFIALSVDLLSRLGGTDQFTDPARATAEYNSLSADARLADMLSSVDYLKTVDGVRAEKLGAVGFCAGGGNCYLLALNSSHIKTAVVFYGTPLPNPLDMVDNLAGPLLAIYAGLDRALTRQTPALVTALMDRNKTFAFRIYDGVGHAFHNDTGPAYNRSAACDAWSATVDFFSKNLKTPEA